MNPAPAGRPTHKRHVVVAFAVSLAILSYLSRVCIAQAAPDIMRDLHLTQEQMGQIFGAFGLSYALFEIPTGWLGDWIGPRRVLLRIVLWWSAFTALSGWMWSATSLWVTRFLFGAGEAGAFPNLTKVFTVWLPRRERLRAQSVMWTAARWGGAITPKCVVIVLLFMNWHWSFVFFGGLGIIWTLVFYLWFRDDPRTHPGVNDAERAIIGNAGENATGHAHVPWGRMVRSRSVWLLWIQYFCLSFPWYFYITWLPDYLLRYWKVSKSESGTLAILPLFMGGLGCLVCGAVSRRVSEAAGGPRASRRILGFCGLAGAAILLQVAMRMTTPWSAMIALGFASFFNDIVMPPAWAACMDVGGKYAGTVSGSMNMMGNLAGYAAPVLGGYIVHGVPTRYPAFLMVMSMVYVVGALCWPFLDPVTPLDPDAAAA